MAIVKELLAAVQLSRNFIAPAIFVTIIGLLMGCQRMPKKIAPATPPTMNEIAGTWKSRNSFYLILDDAEKSFSFADSAAAAETKSGPHGSFSLVGSELLLLESEDSEVCPGMEGRFQAEIVMDGNLRLTIIDDPCIYRVEGLFQGGQGGLRFLDFRPVR